MIRSKECLLLKRLVYNAVLNISGRITSIRYGDIDIRRFVSIVSQKIKKKREKIINPKRGYVVSVEN
jgi:hypothetical protein